MPDSTIPASLATGYLAIAALTFWRVATFDCTGIVDPWDEASLNRYLNTPALRDAHYECVMYTEDDYERVPAFYAAALWPIYWPERKLIEYNRNDLRSAPIREPNP